jgi:hypothetical protein
MFEESSYSNICICIAQKGQEKENRKIIEFIEVIGNVV